MGPGKLTSLPSRIWTVEIRADAPRPALTCRACGTVPRQVDPPDRSLRAAALHHLARHARHDPTPAHLRTCQCGQHGCAWHSRHRGCAGPIRLSLTCKNSPHSWRLADMCEQCTTATPHTAAVPQPLPALADEPHAAPRSSVPYEEELPQVWELTCD